MLDLAAADRREAALAQDGQEVSAQLERCLRTAVDRHLVSDVPVGALLSGGIDSSLLYWLACDTSVPLTTFTKLSPGIESIPQTVVPELLRLRGSPSHFCEESPAGYLPSLVQFVRASHAPARWGGGPAMYHLCREARARGITVLLGGDGIDEYAAGYKTLPALLEAFDGDPSGLHQVVDTRPIAEIPLGARAEAFRQSTVAAKRRLYEGLGHVAEPSERFAEATLLQDVELFLQTCALVNSDAYSMMASVELRNPFLDIDLVEFVVNQPFERKLDRAGGELGNKLLFRQLARRLIGGQLDVPKEGTRNYSKAVSQPELWSLDRFRVAQELRLPANPGWRELFKIINLEIFWTLFQEQRDIDLLSLASADGRRQLAPAA